ncbi:MAG: methyltransferase domain-containing protein, partial [Pseudomonadota bacterium]
MTLSSSSPSRRVASDQLGPHPGLDARVERHRRHTFRRPPHAASVAACERADAWLATRGSAPLILDIGCGTGDSSRALALAHPDAAVVGIDKSAARLGRGQRAGAPDNLLLLQANALDVLPRARA